MSVMNDNESNNDNEIMMNNEIMKNNNNEKWQWTNNDSNDNIE